MAVEAKRGCGYRKVGGLYMVSGKLGTPCGRLPLELHVCPTCKAGVKQTRGWTWVNAAALLKDAAPCDGRLAAGQACGDCPASPLNLARLGEQTGLVWVGEGFYPTADDFMREAGALGVSRRIPAIPRGFKLGEHWLLVAHPKAISRRPVTDDEKAEALELAHEQNLEPRTDDELPNIVRKGVITLFKPTAIEKIVTETQAKDEAAMAELREKGITPIVVPDDDKDHQGSVHDKDDSQEGLL